MLKILETPKLTEGIKQSGTCTEAVTKAVRNVQTYAFMTWIDHYLQMREERINMVAATKEDDNEEYYSKADGLIANPINLKTRQRFCDV